MAKIDNDLIPLIPLRDIIVFPYMVVPLFIGRDKSILAIEQAMRKNKKVFLVAQKKSKIDTPNKEDLYEIGTMAEVIQIIKLPDGAIKVLVEGLSRGEIIEYIDNKEYFEVKINPLFENSLSIKSQEIEAIVRNIINLFEEYITYENKSIAAEIMNTVSNISDPGKFTDIITTHLSLKLSDKQSLLEEFDVEKRLIKISEILVSENEILKIEKKIRGRIKTQIDKTQKEYYLNEQLKAIQKELGYRDEHNEINDLLDKAKKAGMPKEAEEVAIREIRRLEKMPFIAAEATIIRNYIDWLLAIPWNIYTEDKLDIKEAEEILEREHFGLEKIKERVLEYLAVRKLVKKMKSPILCLVGPPGVGKTSLAKSIALALKRNFVRISLGGVKDEAEIRGHRRTYIGAMPGKIIQSIRKAKSKNPVFLLDEVDKMSNDFRGDPASALLEVLDPEQNNCFNDHFIEVDFDLSDVMFITTANVLSDIPLPLRDRMEIISIPGYTEWEKFNIAEKFLVPKLLKDHGLKKTDLVFSSTVINTVIRKYTREAGVRGLERELAKICRKIVKKIINEEEKNRKVVTVTNKNLEDYLGVFKYHSLGAEEKDEVGTATGLAWTEVGGEILAIETTIMKGRGSLILTGKLGEVMQESARAALSYIRSHAKELNIDENFYKKYDIHVHVPEGAIPKDGPSAGISICTSIVSALTGIPVHKDVAMTGEITLRGRVLPIGGVKEKVLAAHRFELKTVILPKANLKDTKDIPVKISETIKFVFVETMNEVLDIALLSKPRIKKEITRLNEYIEQDISLLQ